MINRSLIDLPVRSAPYIPVWSLPYMPLLTFVPYGTQLRKSPKFDFVISERKKKEVVTTKLNIEALILFSKV